MKYIKLFEGEIPQQERSNYETIAIALRDNDPNVFSDIKTGLHDGSLDPLFENCLLLRLILKGTWRSREESGDFNLEIFKIIIDKLEKVYDQIPEAVRRSGIALKWAAELGRIEALDYLINVKEFIASEESIHEANHWLTHSRKITDEKKQEVREFLTTHGEDFSYKKRRKAKQNSL